MQEFRVSKNKNGQYFAECKWLFWWFTIYKSKRNTEVECWEYVNFLKTYDI